jgi:cytochrome c553
MRYWKNSTLAALGFAAALFGSGVFAQAEDAPNGKQLYLTRTCVACHGKDGAKAIQTYPNLAALDQAYLYAQMKDIAEGRRVSGPDARGYPRTQAMKDVMSIVTDDELKTIAAWLAASPPPPIKPGDAAKAAEGGALYAKSGCVACHGAEGIKPIAGNPVIGGQKKEYLVLQIKEIRDGVRTNGKAKMMSAMVKRLTDADIDAIAEHLSQVDRAAAK